MPRNMSFSKTTEEIMDRSKTVTRRCGWWNIKPGEIINACEKCQGLKKGEKIKKFAQIRVLNTAPTQLNRITPEDCIREGFPYGNPVMFAAMFCHFNKGCEPSDIVNRIEFEYLDEITPALSNNLHSADSMSG